MGYLGYLIAGGAVAGEGGSFLMLGLMYKVMLPDMLTAFWDTFIIIGIISLIIGLILLAIGLNKRSHRYDAFV